MVNPLGGSIGYNIWNVTENGDKVLNLGSVGDSRNPDNASAAEVRGSFNQFDLSGNTPIDFDFYQATASFWREAFANKPDTTPVSSMINMGVKIGANDLAGVVLSAYDAYGNAVYSGFDFIFSDGARTSLGEEAYNMLESMDDDFVSAMNQSGNKHEASWTYPVIAGFKPNTFVVGLAGFLIDTSDGSFKNLSYTMQWGFN